MSIDADEVACLRIVDAVRAAFPEEAASLDVIDPERGFEEGPFAWLDRFSQTTTNAINEGRFEQAAAHLLFISTLLESADEPTVRRIDVNYVESLMWDTVDDERKWEGWKLVPTNLRGLYISMWGECPFMDGPT